MTTKLFSPLEQFDVIQLTSFTLFGYDFSFLNVIFPLILLFIFIIFFYFNYLEFKLIPSN